MGKRAIAKSVDQIRGAERWIAEHPNRIFIDRECTQKLPIALPPPERRKVHGIVVALGAGEAVKAYFNEAVGSLFIAPEVRGAAHWEGDHVMPFSIGDVSPDGSFIHILDDATLDIVLGELDTITDLTTYLSKKEALMREGRLLMAGGEEDMLAYYMTHMSKAGEHDFAKEDGSLLGDGDAIAFEPGIYAGLKSDSQYIAKKKADGISYLWDALIETFTKHILDGTSIVPGGESGELSDHERAVRHMALLPRFRRRLMGQGVADAFDKGRKADRFSRSFLPGPTEPNQETGFVFMTIAPPKFELKEGYQQYREVRSDMLATYALAVLERQPKLRRVVGIATEPRGVAGVEGSSEDLVLVEDVEWSADLKADIAKRKKHYDIMVDGKYKQYAAQGQEFPVVRIKPPRPKPQPHQYPPGINRHERRRLEAEERRKRRKIADDQRSDS